MPRIARPPEMWSRVVAIFATRAGSRNVLAPTIRPIRIRSVAWAQAASVSQPSWIGPFAVADDRVEVVPRPEPVVAERVGAHAGLEQRRPVGVLVPAERAELDLAQRTPHLNSAYGLTYSCLTISTEISTAGTVPLFSSQWMVFRSSGQPTPGP